MKALSEFQGVYLHRDPVDMRKAINGLSELVALAEMGDLMGPHLFVFCGKRRDVIKVLYFDRTSSNLPTVSGWEISYRLNLRTHGGVEHGNGSLKKTYQ